MAINIGLSCRNIGELGKPIMVVANEIRTYSERLDQIVSAISKAEGTLLETSSKMNGKHANSATSADQLSQFLEVIRSCDDRSAVALGVVDAKAGNVQSALDLAIEHLEKICNNSNFIRGISSNFETARGECASYSEQTVQFLQSVFDLISKNYTMNDERKVHNDCLPGFAEKILISKNDNPISQSDEEGDGLF